ncbi:tRNA 5-carboxymethoxyuridine methyltransferase [Shewanella algicola]|uniref:tRNA 5-carboxymethoxyuridine methyltransferase n=1 Tax=Shewanella algicola TaxID=640633 RepID=A0A9X1Z497_9GAMM|nr:methyltransferase domain-containing protein [Shewanella algicola]MCL1105003.1 methyltransferase domain-containing protein [Shewanella algicola]GGP47843.1 tRNA 5-carboxymethoxyuridine methyltransferase [Shewanella algicola]
MQDKNFDKLSLKFAKNIYGTTKGEIRAAVLWRDLAPALTNLEPPRLRILDAGGGFGFLSQKLAALGHDVVLCDISEQMLALAKQQIAESDTPLSIELVHSPIQALTVEQFGQFDVILCHAVAEWLIDAKSTLQGLLKLLKPSGLFSLMFYNKEALRFHSLVSGNFDYVQRDLVVKKKIGLTPTHPLYIEDVRQWFNEWQMHIQTQSGVRVINDYLKQHLPPNFDTQQLIEMELAYSQREPYLSLGRYVHFLGQSSTTPS